MNTQLTMTVCMDRNVFFYAKIRDRKYRNACARIMQELAEGKLSGATSTLALVETSNALRKYSLPSEVPDEAGAIYYSGRIDACGDLSILQRYAFHR